MEVATAKALQHSTPHCTAPHRTTASATLALQLRQMEQLIHPPMSQPMVQCYSQLQPAAANSSLSCTSPYHPHCTSSVLGMQHIHASSHRQSHPPARHHSLLLEACCCLCVYLNSDLTNDVTVCLSECVSACAQLGRAVPARLLPIILAAPAPLHKPMRPASQSSSMGSPPWGVPPAAAAPAHAHRTAADAASSLGLARRSRQRDTWRSI